MAKTISSNRRRVPRRTFGAPVGLLQQGKYTMETSFQVGEGGMMISSKHPLVVGVPAVMSFFLHADCLVIVRGVIRSVIPEGNGAPERYGIEFLNLGFQYKREIRNFVAAATRVNGQNSM